MTTAKGQMTTWERPGDSLKTLLTGGNRLACWHETFHHTVTWTHPTRNKSTNTDLKGCVGKKLERIGDVMYSYGAERFGVNSGHRRSHQPICSAGDNRRLTDW